MNALDRLNIGAQIKMMSGTAEEDVYLLGSDGLFKKLMYRDV